MKKHYIFKFALLLIPASAFTLLSFSSGIGGSRSGSPGDGGASCVSCHQPGATFNTSAIITTNIPEDGYDTNTDYQITINTTSTAPGYGFQVTSERLDNNGKVGTFIATSGTAVQNGGSALSHSQRSSTGDWTFTWRSPATDVGDVKFYAAINAVNNANGNRGDEVITISSESVNVLGISEAQRLDFDLFPNPASDQLTIQLPSGSEQATVQFFDYLGRLALTQEISFGNEEINVSNLNSGVYLLRVLSDDKIGSQKFVKN
ncbi:choice-of-anchor V domain-containing protein [uncultured Polaribacter sp.]|uniref:choice-of-anchor V domain-containing protein n=1 Tax=uncultured Polaribacter sp. TaxID=174711 RepID=UPI0026270954|nr:choice-of-anchor V domain-containing protein [uncultured Polaribacter sp.]